MLRLTHYLCMGSLIIFFCSHSIALCEEVVEMVTPNDKEVIISTPETEDIVLEQEVSIEQNKLGGFQIDSHSPQIKKSESSAKGKSILNINPKKSLVNFTNSLKTPRTSKEAQERGWKSKKVATPKPISNLIKEVPKEIEAKKAKLKNKKK